MKNDTRPVRFRLREDDVLHFQHIPKTAGLSLRQILDQFYKPREILTPPKLKRILSGDNASERLAKIRLIYGHFNLVGPYDLALFRHFSFLPVQITLLREPVARTISTYRHELREKHIPAEMTLEDYLQEHGAKLRNRQTYLLVGAIRGNFDKRPEKLPDTVRLQIAKERLEEYAWFGLTERFRESVQLLTYTFGWPSVTNLPFINSAPEPFNASAVAPATLAMIEEMVQLDTELYRYAVRLFNQRYMQMVDELLQSQSTPGSDVLQQPRRPHIVLKPLHRVPLRYRRFPGRVVRSARRRIFPRGTPQERFLLHWKKNLRRRNQT